MAKLLCQFNLYFYNTTCLRLHSCYTSSIRQDILLCVSTSFYQIANWMVTWPDVLINHQLNLGFDTDGPIFEIISCSLFRACLMRIGVEKTCSK